MAERELWRDFLVSAEVLEKPPEPTPTDQQFDRETPALR
jgi:hypothetical protein